MTKSTTNTARKLRGGVLLALSGLVPMLLQASACEEGGTVAGEGARAFEKRSTRYLAGLDETVTIVKGMGTGHALRADGSRVGLVDLSRLDREAWRARWGSLSPDVVSYMQTVPPSAMVEVAILFDPLGDWSEYVKAQYAGGLEAAAARAELQLRVEEGAAELTSQLEQLGIVGAEAAQGTPFVFVSVPASMLPVVGQLEQAAQVVGNGAAETIELSDDVVEPTKFHRADALPNYKGDGYKAAVIEPGTCRVRDTHVLSSGTGVAAPSKLGTLMRAQAYCADQGLDLDAVGLRSLARTAGYSDNPDGWRYSTPKLGSDHADGGGVVYTDVLRRFCAPPGEQEGYEHGIVRGAIDPRSDGTNAPLPNAEPEYPDAPPQAMPQDQSLVPSSSLTGYRWLDLWAASPLNLRRGDRIRATFSWETCVATATGGAAPNDATDYDIFLFNHTTGRGLYASQSNDDVNEGFDVTVPDDANWEGDYGLLLVWPEGSIGCGGADRTGTTWMIQRAQ